MMHKVKVVLDDDGHECLEFSDELMESLDLKVGDVLQWDKSEENVWTLTLTKTMRKIGEVK
jgi:hypothetical protein